MMTLAGYDAMSEDDCRRHELVDGRLVEMPLRSLHHQRALVRLVQQLDEQLPPDYGVVHSFDVLLKGGTSPLMRKPDVVVAPFKRFHDDLTRFDAADVVLLAEILSAESEDVDLRIKAREYAAAGIANYWVVALDDSVSLAAYTLAHGRYELAVGGSRAIDVMSPSPMSLDLDALQRRR